MGLSFYKIIDVTFAWGKGYEKNLVRGKTQMALFSLC